jgi:hypothetical protein
LKDNGGVPLDHPRRCQAHNRSASRKGQPCRRYAAKGATVCTMHGGAAPQVRRKALLRQMFELDQAAQTEAAMNVMLPPELHHLVGGGGRGRRKAAKAAPEPPPPPTLTGIANISRAEHLANQGRAIIDAEVAEPPVTRPESRSPERKPADPIDDREPVSASRSGPTEGQPVPRLMTIEEAVIEPPRRVTRRYR